MSYRILVVMEDPTLDRYVVEPIVRVICESLERAAIRIDVLVDPWLRGVEQALDGHMWEKIVVMYPMVDLFLLVVDRDCVTTRTGRFGVLCSRVEDAGRRFVGCLAIEEVEVWLLAAFSGELGVPWSKVRAECHPKEAFFNPFMDQHSRQGPGGGRKRLMLAAMRRLKTLMRRCPEIQQLEADLAAVTS